MRATRAVRTHGPRVTLAQIARVVGLSAPRLVQRFGSRLQLLAAVEASVDARLLRNFVRGVAEHTSPRAGLLESLSGLAERSAKRLYLMSSSYVFDPRHLMAPEGTSSAQRRIEAFVSEVRVVLDRMVTAGEQPPGDMAALAHAVFVTWVGSYNLWAYAPVGSVGDAVKRDLRYLLAGAPTSKRR